MYRVTTLATNIVLLIGFVVLSGCATGTLGTAGGGGPSVGPELSSQLSAAETDAAAVGHNLPKIDVVVPVFDPNLPKDSDTWEEKGIFAELRRAESNRFALKMKSALVATDAFGMVRVVPDQRASGDLYVVGKIIRSNGEDVKINIAVTDISGRRWFAKDFTHRVKENFHNNIRNKGKDPYDPVFEKAALYVAKRLQKRSAEDLAKLQLISELRFGSSLSQETFGKYLRADGGRVDLVALPADDDPMRQRIKPMRVRDQLFVDRMQTHYTDFDQKLDASYLVWQQQSLIETKAIRKAKSKAVATSIIGGLLTVAGVAAAVDSENSLGTDVAATTAIVAGTGILSESFRTRAEMKVHREAFAELGQSINIEIAPQVVEYENQTAELVGDAAEQYTQWIAFLQKVYELEATPSEQL